jgi:hypothetical protein
MSFVQLDVAVVTVAPVVTCIYPQRQLDIPWSLAEMEGEWTVLASAEAREGR